MQRILRVPSSVLLGIFWLFHLIKGDKFPLRWCLAFMIENAYDQNLSLKICFSSKGLLGLNIQIKTDLF